VPTVRPANTASDKNVRVAVICHHDVQARDAASGFIERLGLQATVLPEAPKPTDGEFLDRLQGLRNLDFAVILLPANALDTATAASKLLPRELLLELGYLLGALGRARICFLLSGNVARTLPWNDVVGLPMDDAALWHLLLARSMKQAGLDVDLNRAL
jgi:predicted nucleotide-binding protein